MIQGMSIDPNDVVNTKYLEYIGSRLMNQESWIHVYKADQVYITTLKEDMFIPVNDDHFVDDFLPLLSKLETRPKEIEYNMHTTFLMMLKHAAQHLPEFMEFTQEYKAIVELTDPTFSQN